MAEAALADLIPLWRTLRENGTTVLVTPALDYVGALELGGLDARFAGGAALEGVGEAVRSLVGSLEDGTCLQFLYRVTQDIRSDLADYLTEARGSGNPLLHAYAQGRAAHLAQMKLRKVRLFLFYSPPNPKTFRGQLGVPLDYRKSEARSAEQHAIRVEAVAKLRRRLISRLAKVSIDAQELRPEEVHQLYFELLNPARARRGVPPPAMHLVTTPAGAQDLEVPTDAEQLCFESVEEKPDHLVQDGAYRRAVSLKLLPEGGTVPYGVRPLLELCGGEQGEESPFAYTLSISVQVRDQLAAKKSLDREHMWVRVTQNPLTNASADKQAQDQAALGAIEGALQELSELSTSVVDLSISALLEASSLPELEAQTEAASFAFADLGNAQMLVERFAQLPGLLAVLPGSGRYPLRKKGCTSRNAADLLPLYVPWRGTARARTLSGTPDGNLLRLDLFDPKLSPAHHGLVMADTGSGKSVQLAALMSDALASGCEAILIDIGNSWKRLTERYGGVHLPVNLRTSICPFVGYAEMLDEEGRLDASAINEVVTYLEVCALDRDLDGFDKVQRDFVSRAVRRLYEQLAARPQERPLIGAFRDALRDYPNPTAEQRAIAERVCSKLSIYCDGIYAPLLNRPSKLRFDAPLLTFELGEVFESKDARQLTLATLIQAITRRARARRASTLVAVDEAHRLLEGDSGAARYLGDCYRTMRKYGVGMWMISQNFSDFLNCSARDAIVGNSALKLFLRHGAGKHSPVVDYFGMSEREAQAFRDLQMCKGEFSDFLLRYGAMTTTVRMSLHPFAYWLFTTDDADRRLYEKARARNPSYSELELLEELATLYPRGAGSSPTRRSA